jgi:glucose-6-phosphate isomerase
LYQKGRCIEILANYHPRLQYLGEWWKQLYGESEGKEHKGIFPASVNFSADLHSMGQLIQDGERNIYETVISVAKTKQQISIPNDADNLDKLNFLAGKTLQEVNKMAEKGTLIAHVEGKVPNILIEIDSITEYSLGQLIYFFEKACAVSGYVLGVNPFDQPGVEAYKTNMYALLGKAGFEELAKEIRAKL